MKNKRLITRAFAVIFFLFASLSAASAHKKREMRGAWMATVANIDWPTDKTAPAESQKKELVSTIDSLHRCGVNAIMFQVRPTADALYKSKLEPWSEWLTGEQGKAPSTDFDPLQVAVEECHKRCMELHAWINPYRVTNTPTAQLAANHIYHKKPELFINYGEKIYFDPGKEETAKFLLKVLKDIVTRYDIDGLHLDDYFYPYPIKGKEFPDEGTFRANNHGFKDKGDWRRDNVNRIVKRIHEMLLETKPWVQFGISPFGVWRNKSQDPKGSNTKAGCTNYDDLYADVLLWADKGWIDYIAPQLYWEVGKTVADYAVLAPWWRENVKNCNLYFGLYASGLAVNKTKAWKTPNELARQLRFNEQCVDIEGVIYYSTCYFLRNPQGLLDSLKTTYQPYPALPPTHGNGAEAFFPLNVRIDSDTLRWSPVVADGGEAISYYVVYAFEDTEECDFDNPKNILCLTPDTEVNLSQYKLNDTIYNIVVTAVNRYGNESEPETFLYWKRQPAMKQTMIKIYE